MAKVKATRPRTVADSLLLPKSKQYLIPCRKKDLGYQNSNSFHTKITVKLEESLTDLESQLNIHKFAHLVFTGIGDDI